MTQVFHLVGKPGSRKTTVAILMAQGYAHMSKVCMLKAEYDGVSRFDPQLNDFEYTGDADPALADVLFIEHPDTFAGARPGDVIMRMEVVERSALQAYCDEAVDELQSAPAFAANPA